MTTTMRTDIHRPSSPDFDPEAYMCWGVYDNNPEWPGTQGTERMLAIRELAQMGYKIGHGSSHQCGHCGSAIRYAALMVHEAAKQYIYVGEDCLEGRFELTKDEFQTLRKTAALNRERMAKAERIAKIYEDHPLLVWLSYYADIEDAATSHDWDIRGWWNGFVADIAWKLERSGELSERQIAAVEKAIVQSTERNDEWAARKAVEAAEPKVEAPEGRVVVEGEVLSTKWVENDFGGALKMLVKADGFRVWSTVPASIDYNGDHTFVGTKIKFTATLTRSNDDPSFAFAKRPTKAERL